MENRGRNWAGPLVAGAGTHEHEKDRQAAKEDVAAGSPGGGGGVSRSHRAWRATTSRRTHAIWVSIGRLLSAEITA